jgi:hypothetical protein
MATNQEDERAYATRNKLCDSYRLDARRRKICICSRFLLVDGSFEWVDNVECLHVVVCIGHRTIWTCDVSHRHRSESRLKAETPFIFFVVERALIDGLKESKNDDSKDY